jgi:YbbR domain-containing protein
MNNFFKSNLFYGITSVLLAIFLLFYVDSIDNPIVEKPYTVNLSTRNLANDLIMDGTPIQVRIRVSGNKTTFYALSSKDFRAWVDLSQAKPGLGTYDIQISVPSGVSLVWMEPKTADIYLDEIGSKTIEVQHQIINTVASGYGNFEPVLTPKQIKITGPMLLLDQVDHALVRIDLDGLKADYVADLPVMLIDKEKKVMEESNITLSQEKVKVQVAITENMSSKSVQVRPAITGEIQEKWLVSSVEVKPTTVRITGSFDKIKDIEYLTTETIDLSLLEESFSGKVKLNVPEGIGVLDGTEVDVNIKLTENLVQRTLKDIPIEVRNAPKDNSYGTLPTKVDVTLEGYPWIFANYSNEGGYVIAVKAFVDLQGKEAGSQDYPIQIECPSDFKVVSTSVETVRLHH